MRRAPCSKALRAVAGALLALLPAAGLRAECACLWEGSFADVAGSADLVVEARIGRIKGNAADIAVESTLKGEAYVDTLRVWLKARDYCRPEVEAFPPGTRWVLALKRIDSVPEGGFDPGTPNISYGRVGDYYLSSCGGYWLRAAGGRVTGNLIDAPRWARDVEMNPVLIDLLQSYLRGEVQRQALLDASREDPALENLLLDTKAFLRGDDEIDHPPP